jgi:hypothetical protein
MIRSTDGEAEAGDMDAQAIPADVKQLRDDASAPASKGDLHLGIRSGMKRVVLREDRVGSRLDKEAFLYNACRRIFDGDKD